MTYFGVLFVFIIPPLLVLGFLALREQQEFLKQHLAGLLTHVVIAVLYTTPWDNYLVATEVWWYDPTLVNGLVIGWVPIEEYTFFVLQALLTGLWLLQMRRLIELEVPSLPTPRRRYQAILACFVLWSISLGILLSGWMPGRYLGLILIWSLPPILIQTAFGADLLFANMRLLVAGILPPTTFLWLVDALAIRSGTWIINPMQTTGISLGPLPLEEMLFFAVTNILLVFGMTLMLSPYSLQRLSALLQGVRERLGEQM